MPRIQPTEVGRLGAVAAISLGVATLAIALLETTVGVPDASSVYIVAVVATAFLAGTSGRWSLSRPVQRPSPRAGRHLTARSMKRGGDGQTAAAPGEEER